MTQLFFGEIPKTKVPSTPIVGIAFIDLFSIFGPMIDSDHFGINTSPVGTSADNYQKSERIKIRKISCIKYY